MDAYPKGEVPGVRLGVLSAPQQRRPTLSQSRSAQTAPKP
jgi:hypothetical protein